MRLCRRRGRRRAADRNEKKNKTTLSCGLGVEIGRRGIKRSKSERGESHHQYDGGMDSEKKGENTTVPFDILTQGFAPLRPRASPRSFSPSPAHSFRSSCSDEEGSQRSWKDSTTDSCHRGRSTRAVIQHGADDDGAMMAARSRFYRPKQNKLGKKWWSGFLARDDTDDRHLLLPRQGDDGIATDIGVGIGRRFASPEMEKMENEEEARFPVAAAAGASSIFEPGPPHFTTSSLGEVLSQSLEEEEGEGSDDDDDGSIHEDENRFVNHRDTFEIMDIRRRRLRKLPRTIHLPHTVFQHLLRYLDFQTFLSLRRTCRCWVAGISSVRPVKVPMWVRMRMPIAPPKNLEAAKRIFRAWKVASEGTTTTTATGVPREREAGVVSHVANDDHDGFGFRLTMSACGDFILATKGRVIYVCSVVVPDKRKKNKKHGLRLEHFRILTSVVCPSHVRAVSLDTNSHQWVWIGVLLEGTVGMVCALRDVAVATGTGMGKREGKKGGDNDCLYGMSSKKDDGYHPLEETAGTFASGGISIRKSGSFSLLDAVAKRQQQQQHAIPVDDGPYFLYPLVCPDGDVPLSVAVWTYQQGRCCAVAFGSCTGVRIYRINALTGQSLYYSFPLSNRSEVLCFFPESNHNGRGVDSVEEQNRIRLVSSLEMGRPSSFKHKKEDGSGSRTGLDSGLGFRNSYEDDGYVPSLWQYQYHRHIVPLSDGCYVLYINPWSANLCLGEIREVVPSSPASPTRRFEHFASPDGRDGVRKMQIKERVVFESPAPENGVGFQFTDVGVFKAETVAMFRHGGNFKRGVVIVVGFENQVWGFFVELSWLFSDYWWSGARRQRRMARWICRCRGAEKDRVELKHMTGAQIGQIAAGTMVVGLGVKSMRCGRLVKVWAWGDDGRGKEWEWEWELGGGDDDMVGGRGGDEDEDEDGRIEIEMKELKRMRSRDRWETEGPDGDVVMTTAAAAAADSGYRYEDSGYHYEEDSTSEEEEEDWKGEETDAHVDAEGEKGLTYADGNPVLWEGDRERGERDVVMRDADGYGHGGGEGRRVGMEDEVEVGIEVWEVDTFGGF